MAPRDGEGGSGDGEPEKQRLNDDDGARFSHRRERRRRESEKQQIPRFEGMRRFSRGDLQRLPEAGALPGPAEIGSAVGSQHDRGAKGGTETEQKADRNQGRPEEDPNRRSTRLFAHGSVPGCAHQSKPPRVTPESGEISRLPSRRAAAPHGGGTTGKSRKCAGS